MKIMAPKPSETYTWDTRIRYAVSVADKEDGETKFDEIAVNEVLMEARVLKSAADTARVVFNRAPLQAMMRSNCMNCHSFRSKLIGPSFQDISKKYAGNGSSIHDLVKHVREGSTGIWGSVIMPSHPELDAGQTEKMVKWIVDFNTRQADYFIGTEGTVRVERPRDAAAGAVILLAASYLDHQDATGEDRVILRAQP